MLGNILKDSHSGMSRHCRPIDPITVVINEPKRESPIPFIVLGLIFGYIAFVFAVNYSIAGVVICGFVMLVFLIVAYHYVVARHRYRKRLSMNRFSSDRGGQAESSVPTDALDDRDQYFGPESTYAQVIEALIGLERVLHQSSFLSVSSRKKESAFDMSILRREMIRRGFPLPRFIIVGPKVAEKIKAIDLPTDLLEPEPIRTHGDRWNISLGLILLSFLFVTFGGSWYFVNRSPGVLGITILLGALIAYRLFKMFGSGFPMLGRSSVVAPGVVSDSREQVWSVYDTVTLITKKSATLGGYKQNLHFKFNSPKDKGFVEFWQRWNHPNPRPELLVEGWEKPMTNAMDEYTDMAVKQGNERTLQSTQSDSPQAD